MVLLVFFLLGSIGAAINYSRPPSSCPINRIGFGEPRPHPNNTSNTTSTNNTSNQTNTTGSLGGGFLSSVETDPISFLLGVLAAVSAGVSVAGGASYLLSRDQVRSTRTQRALDLASDVPTPSKKRKK